jgi:hypothetical protein
VGASIVSGEASPQDSRLTELLEDLLKELSDPVHKRLIRAYGGQDPVESMESELASILRELIASED